MRQYERHILLQIIDGAWKDHLLAMDHLKEGIGLRAYGQRDPLIEYKKESFEMFGHVKERIENEAVRFLFRLEPMTDEERARAARTATPGTGQDLRGSVPLGGRRDGQGRRYTGSSQDRQGGAQRSLPVRFGKEVQEVSRMNGACWGVERRPTGSQP